ncbi:MAG: hypothetical protein E7057_07635 [Lentisphaerae bacterium]|nr:hypothetical protein [Lentisphaerota bacterium]
MNVTAFFLIFISVFMHAAWNFLGKKESPSSAFFLIAAVAGMLFCLPFIIFCGVAWQLIPPEFWKILIVSMAFNVLYYFSLANGYRNGDISLVYPLGRSLPVLLTAVITGIFNIGKELSWGAWIGMSVLFAGCLILPLQSWRDLKIKTYFSKVLFWVLLISAGTTGYTIFDSMGMEILKEMSFRSGMFRAVFYMGLADATIAAGLTLPVVCSKRERSEFKRILFSYSPYIAGVFTAAAYILVLLAMNYVSNVCYIQAFRQMSLPLGMLAGIFLLKEPCSMPKIIGMILVVCGLITSTLV